MVALIGMNNKKISLLLPDLRGGGAERVVVNLANDFKKRGYLVDVVLLSATGEFLDCLHPDIRVVNLRSKRIRWALLPLVRYLRREQPQALLACMWPLTVIAVWARKLARANTRVIVAEHTTWSRSELLARPTVGWQIRTSMRYAFPMADGIVAVSQGAANDLARFAGIDRDAITVIYNPVVSRDNNNDKICCSCVGFYPPAEWWTGSHRRILAVGNLKAIKDYSTLLAAFARLRQHVDARLLILGEGACRAMLETQIRQLGLEGLVFMPGFVVDPRPYYQHADLHVLSSTGEGFAMVIIEALAAGTPVVSTDCPSGPREILSDGKYGWLVPVGDPVALAIAMEEALSAQHDRATLRARAQEFSVDKASDRYLKLLFPEESRGSKA